MVHYFTMSTSKPIALASTILILFCLGCGNNVPIPEDNESNSDAEKTSQAIDGKAVKEDLGEPSSDPISIPEQLIEKRIDEASQIADSVYKGLEDHRNNLFNEGFAQGRVILCAAYRLERLSGRTHSAFHRLNPAMFIETLKLVIARQNFIFITQNNWNPGKVIVSFSIPLARPYQSHEVELVDYYPGYSNNTQFHIDPISNCGAEFLAPIPNSKAARDLEALSVATILARSVRRLRGSPARLRSIENGASKANSLRLILKQLRRDLEFDAADPVSAKQKMAEYERDLSQAVKLMKESLPELKDTYSVPRSEVDEILALFREKN